MDRDAFIGCAFALLEYNSSNQQLENNSTFSLPFTLEAFKNEEWRTQSFKYFVFLSFFIMFQSMETDVYF